MPAGSAPSTLTARWRRCSTGLPSAAAVDRLGAGYVVSAGSVVILIDGDGNERRIEGFGDAQGVAVVGPSSSSPTPPATSSWRSTSRPVVAMSSSPAPPSASPSPASCPAAFSPVTADGAGGFLVGVQRRRLDPPPHPGVTDDVRVASIDRCESFGLTQTMATAFVLMR